jgi:hypothetical protein
MESRHFHSETINKSLETFHFRVHSPRTELEVLKPRLRSYTEMKMPPLRSRTHLFSVDKNRSDGRRNRVDHLPQQGAAIAHDRPVSESTSLPINKSQPFFHGSLLDFEVGPFPFKKIAKQLGLANEILQVFQSVHDLLRLLRLVLLGNDSEYRQGEQQTRFP